MLRASDKTATGHFSKVDGTPYITPLFKTQRMGMQSRGRAFLSQVKPQALKKQGKDCIDKLYLKDANCQQRRETHEYQSQLAGEE